MEKILPLLAVLLVILAGLWYFRRQRRIPSGTEQPTELGVTSPAQSGAATPGSASRPLTDKERRFMKLAEEYRELFSRLLDNGFVYVDGDVRPDQITTRWHWGEGKSEGKRLITVYVTDIDIACVGDEEATLHFMHLRLLPNVHLA